MDVPLGAVDRPSHAMNGSPQLAGQASGALRHRARWMNDGRGAMNNGARWMNYPSAWTEEPSLSMSR